MANETEGGVINVAKEDRKRVGAQLVAIARAQQKEQLFIELDGLHAKYALYHLALISMDIQQRYDLTAREFKLLFNQWLTARQHGSPSLISPNED